MALCFPTFRAESCACPAVPCPALHCPALPRPAVPAKPRPSWSGGRKSPKSEERSSRHPIIVPAPPPCIRRVGCVQVSGAIPGGSQRGIVHFTIPGGQNPDPYFLFEPPSRWLAVNIPQFPGRYLRSQVLLSPGPFSPPVLIFARGCNGVCAIGLTEPTAMRLITLRKT